MDKNPKMERIDKFLANNCKVTRTDCKKLLRDNTITVNGIQVKKLGFRINPLTDIVCINDEQVLIKDYVYYALNKPMGAISTTNDNFGRDSVIDYIATDEKIYPIGRLDKDTHGLILLTNDGELTHKLIHPKYHVDKTYLLTVAEQPAEVQLKALHEGVMLRDGITLPASITKPKPTDKWKAHLAENITETQTVSNEMLIYLEHGKPLYEFEMTIREGKNRQIRRMCETVGIALLDLERIQFGPIKIGELTPGEYRALTKEEIDDLRNSPQRPS